LVLVAFLDSDKVVGVPKVQFREDPGSSQSVEHLRDQWDGVLVLHGGLIETSEVHTQLQSTVFLLANKIGAAAAVDGRWMNPLARFVSI
jgi:hypothetical protein